MQRFTVHCHNPIRLFVFCVSLLFLTQIPEGSVHSHLVWLLLSPQVFIVMAFSWKHNHLGACPGYITFCWRRERILKFVLNHVQYILEKSDGNRILICGWKSGDYLLTTGISREEEERGRDKRANEFKRGCLETFMVTSSSFCSSHEQKTSSEDSAQEVHS